MLRMTGFAFPEPEKFDRRCDDEKPIELRVKEFREEHEQKWAT
ncbi:hypothetical protein ACT3UD_10485 [Glutamicibacter sp. 287]